MAVFTVTREDKHDDMLRNQMDRYIKTNEAILRILGFLIHDRDPAVSHISVHLENGQRLYFTRETVEKLVTRPPERTTLTVFLTVPRIYSTWKYQTSTHESIEQKILHMKAWNVTARTCRSV